MSDKTSLLEKIMEHKKIPFKTPYKSFPKNPRTIRKIERPLKKI
jgi:antitoxin component of RelBE/YafQ-DinJ toxin-antitoxin module